MSLRRITSVSVWAGWVMLVLLASLWIALRGPSGPDTLQHRVDQIASTLRCPVCHDLSVADSPSALARSMRETIDAKLRAGETPDQIRASFARSYGSWVLLTPPPGGLATAARLAPIGLLLLGAAVVIAVLRRLRRADQGLGTELRAEERGMLEEARARSIGATDR